MRLVTSTQAWFVQAPLRPPVDTHDVRRHRELERLRIFADAYGLDAAGRARTAAAVLGHHAWMCRLVGDGAREGVPGFVEYWTPDAQERAGRTETSLSQSSCSTPPTHSRGRNR